MSKCKCRPVSMPQVPMTMPMPVAPATNCICDFPTLIILILIVLQFSRFGKTTGYGYCDKDDDYDDCCDRKCTRGTDLIGNGVLFIIALFFLSCVGCGRGGRY